MGRQQRDSRNTICQKSQECNERREGQEYSTTMTFTCLNLTTCHCLICFYNASDCNALSTVKFIHSLSLSVSQSSDRSHCTDTLFWDLWMDMKWIRDWRHTGKALLAVIVFPFIGFFLALTKSICKIRTNIKLFNLNNLKLTRFLFFFTN